MKGDPGAARHPRRVRKVARIALFCGLLLFLAAPAGAQTGPPDPAPTPPQGCPGGPPGPGLPGTECPDGSVPAPIPAGCEGSPLSGPPAAGTTCPDGSVVPAQPEDDPAAEVPAAEDQLAEILAVPTSDEHPLTAYDIGCDEGAWDAFLRKMWCGTQTLPFALGKWSIGLVTGVMDWAMDFTVAQTLTSFSDSLSRIYATSFIGQLNIRDLAWTVALFVGGWNLMRARFADGAREIATTFIIAILGSIVLANPDGYLEGSATLAQNSSGAVIEAVDSTMNGAQPDSDSAAVRERLGFVLRQSFVAEPYDLINWGGSLSGECAVARDEILRDGPWGSDDRPREIMREHGCESEATYNEKPSDNRAAAAITVAAASGLLAVLLGTLAVGVFAAQATLTALFAGASLVWVVALFPGARGILWWWLSRLVWAVLITFTSVFLLSWIAITVTTVLDNTDDVSIVQRCLIALVIVAVAYKFRSAVDRGIDRASSGIAGMLRKTASPAAAGAAAGGAAAAGGGFQALSLNPVTTGLTAAGAGATIAASAAKVARANTERARSVGGGAARAAEGARNVGESVVKRAKSVVMLPVTLPERVGQARVRATQRSADVRARLDQARATRAQWRENVRHPLSAVRTARSQAAETSNDHRDWM